MLNIAYIAFSYLSLFGFLALQASFLGLLLHQTIFYLLTGFISIYILITCKTIAANIADVISKQALDNYLKTINELQARARGPEIVKNEETKNE
jgi:ABC-type transport system involved in multi-copper enzyme maturation permease subunit